MTLKKMCIIAVITCLTINHLQGQQLQLSAKRELAIGGSLIMISGASYYLSNHYQNPGHTWEIAGIDQWHKSTYNKQIAHISDATFLGTLAVSAFTGLALPKNQQFSYGVIMAQNIWLTANVVQLTKVIVGRNRPYMNGSGQIPEATADNRYSFFSGHAALSSSLATTALLATYKNYQGSTFTWGKATAVTGAALALTTGILRISAGKHYPSDVIVGIIVGSSISLINTLLHETK